jgi:hypothetical protein
MFVKNNKFMRKIVLLLFLNCVSIATYSQITPQVDERTELMSVVFRLAEAKEYVTNDIPVYSADIDSFFAPYKEHSVVEYSKLLRQNFGIGYDAVMSMAVNLSIENNEVKLKDNINPCDIDSRWQCDSIPQYILFLNNFYSTTNFRRFFAEHNDLYTRAEKNFAENVIANIKFSWFENFYGENAADKFNIIVSLSNGGSNYGPHTTHNNGKEDYFAIIGSWQTDSLGYPIYSRNVGSFVVHEFNHSFCNKLIYEYFFDFQPKIEIFSQLTEERMSKMAYKGAKTYLSEILVRACVIRYGAYNQENENVNLWVAKERNNGFLWIEDLNRSLTDYENNRKQYPTLQSFMPEIVKTHNALNPQKMYRQFIKNQPTIIGTNIKNGTKNIDPNLDHIVVKFNKPMNIYNNGSSYGRCKNCEFPIALNAKWNQKSKKEWILFVKLKPDTEYSLSFPAQFFFSENNYYSPQETYWLDFKTK